MMNNTRIRCFLAFDLSEDVKYYVRSVIEKNQKRFPLARWVTSDKLHVTLQFFPALPSSQVDQVKLILSELCSQFQVFDCILNEIGVFPSWNRVRVLWIGFDQNSSEQMKKAATFFQKKCRQNGIGDGETQKFSPHLTLARFKNPISISPQQLFQPTWYTSSIQQVSFYESTLTPRGPIYTPLITLPLKEVK